MLITYMNPSFFNHLTFETYAFTATTPDLDHNHYYVYGTVEALLESISVPVVFRQLNKLSPNITHGPAHGTQPPPRCNVNRLKGRPPVPNEENLGLVV